MKPDWKDAPSWANFRAQDDNGEWYWFECKPKFNAHRGTWNEDKGRWISFTLYNSQNRTDNGTLEPRP